MVDANGQLRQVTWPEIDPLSVEPTELSETLGREYRTVLFALQQLFDAVPPAVAAAAKAASGSTGAALVSWVKSIWSKPSPPAAPVPWQPPNLSLKRVGRLIPEIVALIAAYAVPSKNVWDAALCPTTHVTLSPDHSTALWHPKSALACTFGRSAIGDFLTGRSQTDPARDLVSLYFTIRGSDFDADDDHAPMMSLGIALPDGSTPAVLRGGDAPYCASLWTDTGIVDGFRLAVHPKWMHDLSREYKRPIHPTTDPMVASSATAAEATAAATVCSSESVSSAEWVGRHNDATYNGPVFPANASRCGCETGYGEGEQNVLSQTIVRIDCDLRAGTVSYAMRLRPRDHKLFKRYGVAFRIDPAVLARCVPYVRCDRDLRVGLGFPTLHRMPLGQAFDAPEHQPQQLYSDGVIPQTRAK